MFINVNSQSKSKLLDKYMNNNIVCIVLYYSDTCFYCKMMQPEWTKFEKKYNNNNDCVVAKVESINMDLLSNRPNIMGYPTICKYVNGKKTEYSGDRSCSDLVKFANIKSKEKSKTNKKEQSVKKKSKSKRNKKQKSVKKKSKSKRNKKQKSVKKKSKSKTINSKM